MGFTLLNEENDVSDEDLVEFLPEQIFPDVEDLRLEIGEKTLRICGSDGEWGLNQSDILLAAGAGCMTFHYTGEPGFKLERDGMVSEISFREARETGLPKPADILMIKRGKPCEFVFSCGEQGRMTIFAEVVNISWKEE